MTLQQPVLSSITPLVLLPLPMEVFYFLQLPWLLCLTTRLDAAIHESLNKANNILKFTQLNFVFNSLL